jgi:hypothetical protein
LRKSEANDNHGVGLEKLCLIDIDGKHSLTNPNDVAKGVLVKAMAQTLQNVALHSHVGQSLWVGLLTQFHWPKSFQQSVKASILTQPAQGVGFLE